VHLEASTKPHVHEKFQIFWTNIAFTMACPNFKNGPKNGLGPLGVNEELLDVVVWLILPKHNIPKLVLNALPFNP
jgi:hypothetical protein